MISKKLLSKVLNKPIDEVLGNTNNELSFILGSGQKHKINDNIQAFINIYELTHRCKEWAKDKELFFHVDMNNNDTLYIQVFGIDSKPIYTQYNIKLKEPNAVFEICEWILHNNKDKS